MNESRDITQYSEAFSRLAASLPGAQDSLLQDHRRVAMEQFSNGGFPTLRQEEWKYTDVTPLTTRAFHLGSEGFPDAIEKLSASVIKPYSIIDANADELVFVNGRFSTALSRRQAETPGVRVQSLGEALQSPPAGLVRAFEKSAHAGFTALNAAFANDGAYIELSNDVELAHPIHLLFLSTKQGDAFAQFPRIVITAGRNSRAQILETYVGIGDGANFTNTYTCIRAAAGAQLEHYKLQDEAGDAYHIGRLDAALADDSTLSSFSISLGAQLARHDLAIKLDAPGAHIDLFGLYMGQNKQHVDHHTRVDHLAPHTNSIENYRGIMDDASRGVFNGKVVVHPNAQKIDAQQSNKNLLLSDRAEVDTKPELEIYADDVACAHGATVGQLDENALFYLLSRGISEGAAQSLLTYAFAAEILDKINIAPLRQHLSEAIVGHLPESGLLKDLA
jgi:Fe-S cluster assembly protein SufD